MAELVDYIAFLSALSKRPLKVQELYLGVLPILLLKYFS